MESRICWSQYQRTQLLPVGAWSIANPVLFCIYLWSELLADTQNLLSLRLSRNLVKTIKSTHLLFGHPVGFCCNLAMTAGSAPPPSVIFFVAVTRLHLEISPLQSGAGKSPMGVAAALTAHMIGSNLLCMGGEHIYSAWCRKMISICGAPPVSTASMRVHHTQF